MIRYTEVFFRYWVRFTVLLLVAPAIVGAVTVLLFPTYRAYSRLWVDNPSYFGANPTGWSQYLTPAQNEADSLNQLMATRVFGDDLSKRLESSIPDRAERIQALKNANLQLGPIGTHLILVSASCDRPQVCAAVVNAGVDALRDEQVKLEQDQAKAGIDFLNSQLKDAEQQQQQAQNDLQQWIANHPGVKVDANAANDGGEVAGLLNQAQQTTGRVNDIQASLGKDRYVASVSTALYADGPRVLDSPEVTRGGLIGDGASLKKAGVAAAAVLGVGLAYLFLLGWMDKTVRYPGEIEHRLNVRVVASIPELSAVERL